MTQADDKASEKREAINAVESALAEIESEDRQPDQWERVFLVQAISSLFRGAYRLAGIEADLSMTPEKDRARKSNLPADEFYKKCDIETLRKALIEAKNEPIKPFPQFGPVEFR